MRKIRKIYININSECNCRCVNCILKEESRTSDRMLSLTDINDLVKLFPNIVSDDYINIAEISGGEPTLHEDCIRILSLLHEAKQSGLIYKIALLTNGITSADSMFCKEISKYIDDVVITLYDTDEKNHDWFTQCPGSFRKKVHAIDNFLNEGVKVHIKLLVIKPSYKNLPNIAEYISKRWGEYVHVAINGTHYTGDAQKNNNLLAVKNSEARVYVEMALDVFGRYNVNRSVFFPLCMLDPIYWKYSPRGFKELIDSSLSISPSYKIGKAERLLDEFIHRSNNCQDCVLVERCNWPWKRYSEIFDEDEIKNAKNILYNNLNKNNYGKREP